MPSQARGHWSGGHSRGATDSGLVRTLVHGCCSCREDWVDSWTVHVGHREPPCQARRPTSCRSTGTTGSSPSTHCGTAYPSTDLNNSEEHPAFTSLYFPYSWLLIGSGVWWGVVSPCSSSSLSHPTPVSFTNKEEGSKESVPAYHLSSKPVIWLVWASSWEMWLTSRRSLL